MFRNHLMRGASAGALTLSCGFAAQAQTPLPDIRIGAARSAGAGVGSAVTSRVSTPVSAPAAPPPAGERTQYLPEETVVGQKEIKQDKPRLSSTAQILEREPGVSMYQMGGVSGLPVIRGQADERIKVIVGGVQTTSACANHMNNPLSYTDPNTIDKVDVVYAVSSVSKGGDFDRWIGHRDAAFARLPPATRRAGADPRRKAERNSRFCSRRRSSPGPAFRTRPSCPGARRARSALAPARKCWRRQRLLLLPR